MILVENVKNFIIYGEVFVLHVKKINLYIDEHKYNLVYLNYISYLLFGGVCKMKVKTGYLYHIKDEYFDVVNDENLMQNHERGKKRPTYFTIKDKNILWFIPISSKVEKYQKIIDKKVKKYGFCNTIMIRKIAGSNAAILLQNAFPTIEKYIDHVHTVDGVPLKVPTDLQAEIKSMFKNMLGLKKRGTNLFFADIDSLVEKMIKENK